MMYNIDKKIKGLIAGVTVVLFVASCAPVNRFTKVKRLPGEYSQNYNAGGVKAGKGTTLRQPWIVYADRAEDMTHQNPGGKIKSADISFLEPFLVIKRKRDYLELIKYKPENLKFTTFVNRKKAEYVGWVHISHLITSPSVVTDVRTSKKLRYLTAMADTSVIFNPQKFFATTDSLKCYNSPAMENPAGTVGLYEIVYSVKESADKKSVLVARDIKIEPDKAAGQVVGWLAKNALQNIGHGVYITTDLARGVTQPDALKYSPVVAQVIADSVTIVRSAVAKPVIDITRRKVFNVNGEAISYGQGQQIKDRLKRINVIFSIEPAARLKEVYPMLLNVVYNTREAVTDPRYIFHFGAAVNTGNNIETLPLTPDFDQFCDWLTAVSDRAGMDSTGGIQSWRALDEALHLVKNHSDANNIIVEIGEQANAEQSGLKRRADVLSRRNCRLLGWQIYADAGNSYNNFVIELSQMIEQYAGYQLTEKRKYMLYPSQLRFSNVFKEFAPNSYTLNFPVAAVTQGMVLFPEKGTMNNIESLSGAIDSLLAQVKSDITGISDSFDKSFLALGNSRDVYALSLTQRFNMPDHTKLHKDFAAFFKGQSPLWYFPVPAFAVHPGVTNYRLLLSKPELDKLKETLDALSAREVDVKDVSKQKKRGAKTVCEYLKTEESELTRELLDEYNGLLSGQQSQDTLVADTVPVKIVYASTRKVRSCLRKLYLSSLNNCTVCRNSKKSYRKQTLSEAHRKIFGVAANNPFLGSVRIKDLKKSGKISDAELDTLINYFKDCKKKFEEKYSEEQFSSGSQSYYYINSKILP